MKLAYELLNDRIALLLSVQSLADELLNGGIRDLLIDYFSIPDCEIVP